MNTEAKHTPTPWAYDAKDKSVFYDDGGIVFPRIALIDDNTSPAQQAADGVLICRAVNSHAALVDALQDILDNEMQESEDQHRVFFNNEELRKACAALALALEG